MKQLVVNELLKNIKTGNIFDLSHDRNSLQQGYITKLTKMMSSISILRTKDQQQSFGPLANSTVD